MGKMKAMLSQPMAGKTQEEIVATRERAVKVLESQGYEVVNTLFTDEWYSQKSMEERGIVQIPLCFLAKSLENMSKCHAAYFCDGWEFTRGCAIEHEAAKQYGLTILYETFDAQAPAEEKTYIGVERVKAYPQERNLKPGYTVKHEDGRQEWCPKYSFEKYHLPLKRPDKLTQEDIDGFMKTSNIYTETRGNKTTLVEVIHPTGFNEIASSSCVSPDNYDEKVGKELCLNQIKDRLWSHLGFILQWSDKGLK